MSATAQAHSEEQADLVAMLDAVLSDADDSVGDDRPAEVAALRSKLAELGVWTLGVAEELGGGGAEDVLAATAFARLGRSHAALAWAAVQAHAAAELLGELPELRAGLHAGDVAVAVTESARVDAAGETPHVILLEEEGARLYEPDSLTYRPLHRTGLDGALTRTIGTVGQGIALDGDVAAARARLWLGAAAVAAGLAEAASEAALGYSAMRQQFGGPLIKMPTVRDSLFGSSGTAATLLRQVYQSMTATPWQAAAVLDTACEAAIDAAARAVQSHGGYGYLTEYPVERLLRDAVSLRAASDTAAARRAGALDLASSAKGSA